MSPSFARKSRALLASTALLAALALAAPAAAASTNATVNLIQLLIKNKVITKEAGEALLAQAEAEAAQARAAEAKAAPPVAVAGAAAGGAVAGGAVATATLPPPAPGTIRVPYIPEAMRAKITDDIKKEVLAQAQTEGWASANQVPDWVQGVTLYGDVRFRNESQFYSPENADELIDFERFNEISPVDINANTNPTGFPLLNTRTNRPSRFRLRARLGLKADLGDLAQIGVRLATGDDRSPISTNQVLGGGLTKKPIWLDQGYVKLTPAEGVTASFGRFANPFRYGSALFDTAELVFDNDLNFDGIAVKVDAQQWLDDDAHLALAAGAFPLGYASPTFPDNAIVKAGDGASKWLFSAQLRGGYRFGEDGLNIDASVAYHSFKGLQGQLSAPCALFNGNTQCSSDQYRPEAVRKGNTLFFLRDIAPDPASPTNFAQPQLIGLPLDYDVLDLGASIEVPLGKNIAAVLSGQYIHNLGADRNDLCRFAPKGLPINNISVVDPIVGALPGTPGASFYTNPCTADSTGRIASYNGGNTGYLIRGVVGVPEPRKFGDWNFELSYRYIEADATVDAFSDSDFHLGGTNAKGYAIGGSLGLAKGVFLVGRWLSANQISGPPLAIDVLQIDLVAAF